MKSLYRQFKKIEKEMNALVEIKSRGVILEYALAFKDIDNQLSDIYREYADAEGQINFNEYKKYKRMDKTNKEMAKALRKAITGSSRVSRVLIKEIIKESYRQSIEVVNEATKWNIRGIQKDTDITEILNEKVEGYNWTERMGKNRSETIARVRKSIEQSLKDGDVYNVAAEKLSRELEISMNKSLQIARTESHRAMSHSKQESFKDIEKQGGKIRKRWVTARDERVRGNDPNDKTNHIKMDNVTVDISEDFILPSGAKAEYPGDPKLPAEESINCRCIQVLEIES